MTPYHKRQTPITKRMAEDMLVRNLAVRMRPAAAMMLHTWNQRLDHHPHVHALIPGSGPSLDGTTWIPCRHTIGSARKPSIPFLVDNKLLGWRFRDAFLQGLRRLWQQGNLKLRADQDLEATLSPLEERDWVVFIQPPPRKDSRPEHVVKYLARCMTGGPISDRRLSRLEGDRKKRRFAVRNANRRWRSLVWHRAPRGARSSGTSPVDRRKRNGGTRDEARPSPETSFEVASAPSDSQFPCG